MGAQGINTLDFGAFPGSNVAVTDVSAPGVTSVSVIQAELRPLVSADHSATDHVAAPMKVTGRFLSNDNIRITGINTNDVIPPLELVRRKGALPVNAGRNYTNFERQNPPMFVGVFNVFWCWRD